VINQSLVLKSLEELGGFSELFAEADHDQPPDDPAPAPAAAEPSGQLMLEADLDRLADAVSRAAEELREIAAADAAIRQEAEAALARYRRLTGDAARLAETTSAAEAVAEQATALSREAFEPSSRQRVEGVITTARAVTATARRRAETLEAEAASLASRQDVGRLLAEEEAREEAARREAEEHERQVRLREGITRAEALAREHKYNEACRLLGDLGREHPDSPELASSVETIRQQEAVKATRADEALRQVRRVYRREPREAIALLEPLDLAGLPDSLVRQTYGCWLQACRRLRLANAVQYSPSFGRGAVLVPSPDGRLEVVSAIGLAWKTGRRLSPTGLKGARPLA
jgi:uncharacterized protein (DUF1697 family)